mgnify:CR=1 FL=1
MSTTYTIELDDADRDVLDSIAERMGVSCDEVPQEIVRRRLIVEHVQRLRQEVIPIAKAKGIETLDDVLRLLDR